MLTRLAVMAAALVISVTPAVCFDVAEPTVSFVRGELQGEKIRALVKVTNKSEYPLERMKLTCRIISTNNTKEYVQQPEAWLQSIGSKGEETVWLELYSRPPSEPTDAICIIHEYRVTWLRR